MDQLWVTWEMVSPSFSDPSEAGLSPQTICPPFCMAMRAIPSPIWNTMDSIWFYGSNNIYFVSPTVHFTLVSGNSWIWSRGIGVSTTYRSYSSFYFSLLIVNIPLISHHLKTRTGKKNHLNIPFISHHCSYPRDYCSIPRKTWHFPPFSAPSLSASQLPTPAEG